MPRMVRQRVARLFERPIIMKRLAVCVPIFELEQLRGPYRFRAEQFEACHRLHCGLCTDGATSHTGAPARAPLLSLYTSLPLFHYVSHFAIFINQRAHF